MRITKRPKLPLTSLRVPLTAVTLVSSVLFVHLCVCVCMHLHVYIYIYIYIYIYGYAWQCTFLPHVWEYCLYLSLSCALTFRSRYTWCPCRTRAQRRTCLQQQSTCPCRHRTRDQPRSRRLCGTPCCWPPCRSARRWTPQSMHTFHSACSCGQENEVSAFKSRFENCINTMVYGASSVERCAGCGFVSPASENSSTNNVIITAAMCLWSK
jgi:hypothetical protein